jgi:hypothetical protein
MFGYSLGRMPWTGPVVSYRPDPTYRLGECLDDAHVTPVEECRCGLFAVTDVSDLVDFVKQARRKDSQAVVAAKVLLGDPIYRLVPMPVKDRLLRARAKGKDPMQTVHADDPFSTVRCGSINVIGPVAVHHSDSDTAQSVASWVGRIFRTTAISSSDAFTSWVEQLPHLLG